MAHKGHAVCEFTSKAAYEKARRIAIGQCRSMLDELRQCPHWGVDSVDGRGYCGQHIGTIFRRADEEKRAIARREALNRMIDQYMDSHGARPHYCGERCEFSMIGGNP